VAFQFEKEAAKDIRRDKVHGVTLLKAQMNADLQTDDLKKKRSSNESFLAYRSTRCKNGRNQEGEDKGRYRIKVLGFDYYNPVNGTVESGGGR